MATSRAPRDLVAEVAASSVSYDLHDKLKAIERNGVREYIVWRVLDHADRLVRSAVKNVSRSSLQRKTAPSDSTVFPGPVARPAALLRDDFDRLLDVLQAVSTPPNTPNSWPACAKRPRTRS